MQKPKKLVNFIMSNDQQRKYKEKEQLLKALSLLNINKDCIDEERESPDFLLDINQKKIGVEITEIYIKENLDAAKIQANISNIPKEVTQKYNDNSGIPCIFSFGFNGCVNINNRKEVIASLSDYMLNAIQFEDDYTGEVVSLDIPNNKIFTKIIKSIHIQRIDNNKSTCITLSNFESANLTAEVISDCVNKKEKHLRVYRQSCDEIWLLMVLPTMHFSNEYLLQVRVEKESITSGFDKLLLLDEYRNKIKAF